MTASLSAPMTFDAFLDIVRAYLEIQYRGYESWLPGELRDLPVNQRYCDVALWHSEEEPDAAYVLMTASYATGGRGKRFSRSSSPVRLAEFIEDCDNGHCDPSVAFEWLHSRLDPSKLPPWEVFEL